MVATPPIDYKVVARALWSAVQVATGLPGNSVVMAEAEEPVSNRPKLPYCSYKIMTASVMYGDDAVYPTQAADNSTEGFFYAGPRGLGVAFDFYGRDHLEAYSYAAMLQGALWQDPTNEPLVDANMAVWQCGDVTDLSLLLSTGFEGRAHLNCMFGMTARSATLLDPVEAVSVEGVITDDSLNQHQVTCSLDRTGS